MPPDELELLERWLEALTSPALAPDPETLERVRTQVSGEFRLRAAARAGRPVLTTSTRRWPRWTRRPAAAFGLAGALLLGSFGLVAANSGPGDPIYGLRLAAEELTLPGSGSDRLRGHLENLDERLAEASREAGDPAAVRAALDAYRAELSRALAEADGSQTDWRAILDALERHQAALDRLEKQVPADATTRIQRAIDQVDSATERVRREQVPSPTPADATPPASPRPAPSPTPSPDRPPRPTTLPVETHRATLLPDQS